MKEGLKDIDARLRPTVFSWNPRIKKKKKKGTKEKVVFKKIMAANFPELVKNMIPQIQHTLSKISNKISTTGNIIANLWNITNQGHEISKFSREMIEGIIG